jgi:hypothetical protein
MRRSLRWLHRLGYVCTAIVTLELLAAGALAAHFWLEDRERLYFAMERTRTHAGPLTPGKVRYRPDESDLFSTLPPIDARNGLRFAAMPSLRGPWFAYSIAVPTQTGRVKGVLNIFPRNLQTGDFGATQTIRFTMPAATGQVLLSKVSNLTKDWGGKDDRCLDGTGVAFELAMGGNVTSGSGNSACSEHYGALSLLFLKPVQGLIPMEIRPMGKGWRANSAE